MSEPQPPRTAIVGTRVFDGTTLSEPRTVVIEGSSIAADTSTDGAQIVHASGAVLLPGFIDAHAHVEHRELLDVLASYGVTTALDMALSTLGRVPGTCDLRSPGLPAISSRSMQAKIPGMPETTHVDTPQDAKAFIAGRVANGADYIKIVLGDGLDEATAAALVDAAHAHGLKTVIHAVTSEDYTAAMNTSPEFITHVPLGQPLTDTQLTRLRSRQIATIPTLTMMEGVASAVGAPEAAFAGALRSVGLLHGAGVPILAGTDTNTTEGVPFSPEHGSSLHHELELLVRAGLRPLEALTAATTLPARLFGLTDRGTITPGARADLVLLDGDPLSDIRATRALQRVWCAGIEHTPACA
ncbi:amidohydrolase family protein [Streptomyces sp. NPDC008092]|uniref:amidohydrolase family protein n=1 Tax=Streptomyces sp. NPDC008092 TaxID=3364808 RepID=UPI0036E0A1BF